MDLRFSKKNLPIFYLIALIAATALSNYLWLSMNQRPPVDDEAMHLLSALKYTFLFVSFPFRWDLILTVDFVYPPLFPFLAALISRLLGVSGIAFFVMNNIFFLGIAFLSLYGIGIKLGDRRLGVLAAFILALCPMFFQLSRMFMLEIPLIAMVTLSLWLVLRSDGFRHTSWSVLAALAVGCGMLTKQSFIIFWVGPALYSFLNARALADSQGKRRQFLNIGLLATLGMAVLFYWYAENWNSKFHIMTALVKYQRDPASSFSFFASLIFYLKVLVRDQMSWFLGGVCVLTMLTRSKKLLAPPLLFALIWFMVPYVVLSLFPNKLHYYTMPSLPAAALITSFGLLSIPRAVPRRIAVTVLLCFAFFQYIQFSFMSPHKRTPLLRGTRYTPVQKNYHVDTLIRRISEESPVSLPTIGAMPLDADNYIRDAGIRIGENHTLTNIVSLDCLLSLASKPWPLSRVSYFKHQPPPPRPSFYLLHDRIETLALLEPIRGLYQLIDIFVMPDMSRAYLYKMRKSLQDGNRKVRVHQSDFDAILDNSRIRLTLADGLWKISYQGQEITKELSLYTLIQSGGRWTDSRLCRWKVNSRDRDRIIARASGSFADPVQDWEFVLQDDRLEWTVRIHSLLPVNIRWEQFSIMLSDVYRRWVTSRGSGDFPSDFSTEQQGNWPTTVSLRSADTDFIGVDQASDSFPPVFFSALEPRPGLTAQILNSDSTLQGRVLQYSAQQPPWTLLGPQRSIKFHGRLMIGNTASEHSQKNPRAS
ncbi:MAG: glycosyltransferase family 39 protein [Candidatus Omnitrophica bacterium]|nr:glycosyltransferase family 39 protein [Candidatus Omnitrophota bacterium]